MSSASDLTLAFINKRPESAARVLATLPTEDAAAFTESIPTRFAVRLLSLANAKSAAAIVAVMEDTAAMAVIRDMDFLAAAAILRQIPTVDRVALLAELPRRQRRAFETSLAFAADTVGANMSMDIDAVLASDSVADALRLKRDHRENCSELTFVVDDKRAFSGVVPLLSLLQYPERTALSELVETNCVSVSPHMRLHQIANLDAWHKFSQLPVVSRRGELIGAIHRQSISPADSTWQVDYNSAVKTASGATLEMMGQGALGLINLLSDSAPEQNSRGGSDVS